MTTSRVPKQWKLSKAETSSSVEAWRYNLLHLISQTKEYEPFLEGTWPKKSSRDVKRGFTDDVTGVGAAAVITLSAQTKVVRLEQMLSFVASWAGPISRANIINQCTSLASIWTLVRSHYGIQESGSRVLDIMNIKQADDDTPEDLFQNLCSFMDDCQIKKDGALKHHGVTPSADEELSPLIDNITVALWLYKINPGLPGLIKQKYGTELRNKTLASLKDEISVAIPSLLDELQANDDIRVMRQSSRLPRQSPTSRPQGRAMAPVCSLCKEAGRTFGHHLTKCRFLPEADKAYFRKLGIGIRPVVVDETPLEEVELEAHLHDDQEDYEGMSKPIDTVTMSSRRVHTLPPPTLPAFYRQYATNLTLDTGAESNLLQESFVTRTGMPFTKSEHRAFQADGCTPLEVVGEAKPVFYHNGIPLQMDALVIRHLDVEALAGTPFLSMNDITIRPSRQEVRIGNHDHDLVYNYQRNSGGKSPSNIRFTQSVIRAPISTTIWPGEYIDIDLSSYGSPTQVAIQPSTDASWPPPQVLDCIFGHIRVPNDGMSPIRVQRQSHLACALPTLDIGDLPLGGAVHNLTGGVRKVVHPRSQGHQHASFTSTISLDPQSTLTGRQRQAFLDIHERHQDVFDSRIVGYNGAAGNIKAKVAMGPTLPPQHRGRVPLYARSRHEEMQAHFDELESVGVFVKPEIADVNVEYVNPSFLVNKPNGQSRLVTAFPDIGRYAKPMPSMLPSVDSTLRTIGGWQYIIKTDLTKAYYQIPLDKDSMRFCGVVTPFKGIRAYARAAMGMPGSEVALEELMCRVLGDQLQAGTVAKVADDLFCGASSIDELLRIWDSVLSALDRCDLRLSPAKTVVCPKSTPILGWLWSAGRISATSHAISPLTSCAPPGTVKALRSFVGAYKILSRVIPHTARLLAPLEDVTAGKNSSDSIVWTDELVTVFRRAQQALQAPNTIHLPRPSDQLWIVTDASSSRDGLGATLYLGRRGKLLLGGFFSSKLKKHHINWIPCEIEGLAIATAVRHFSPYLIQAHAPGRVLTDSKPCMDAYEKLCRGEFSASPRLMTFLSSISRYQVTIQHLAGSANLPTDFASRNAQPCEASNCQVCSFVSKLETATVLSVSVRDILTGSARLPFTNRAPWNSVQLDCGDLRRVHAHLKQGTRPSKKLTNIKDIKRYLAPNLGIRIARDGLLVISRDDALIASRERTVVPRYAVDGLLSALHLRLDHPSRHQMRQLFSRYFFCLDMDKAIETGWSRCHHCASLQRLPSVITEQTTTDSPTGVGMSFAADVFKHRGQNVLILRETVSDYTGACLVSDEGQESLYHGLCMLALRVRPIDGPSGVVRVDPGPGFAAIAKRDRLKHLNLTLEIGRVKNPNKNPVAEHAVDELRTELKRMDISHTKINAQQLETACARLNSRLRSFGLSAYEIIFQRDQLTNSPIPIEDYQLIMNKFNLRERNHASSTRSKCRSGVMRKSPRLVIGDLVYLVNDKDKLAVRPRYLVESIDGEWCMIRKFSSTRLGFTQYKVHLSECYRVPVDRSERFSGYGHEASDSSDGEDGNLIISENVRDDVPEAPMLMFDDNLAPEPDLNVPIRPPDPGPIPPVLLRPASPVVNVDVSDHTEVEPPPDLRPVRPLRRPGRFNDDYVYD